MAFERVTGTGLGVEPAPAPRSGETAPIGDASPALRLQILSTEHWSLLASRSFAWNEAFSRAGMFLSTLTGAIVALALVAQASAFGEGFAFFALVILPIVLFIGVATCIRLGTANYHEALCVIGMNRIRAAYLGLAPDLERYFVMSAHDDSPGIGITMGVQPGGGTILVDRASGRRHADGCNDPELVLAGTIAAIAAIRVGAAPPTALFVGGSGYLIALVTQAWYANRNFAKVQAAHRPLFPTPQRDKATS
jgi:hypothetical protein